MLCIEDAEMTEFTEDAVRKEEETLSNSASDTSCDKSDAWHQRTVHDPVTNTVVDKLSVAKMINTKIPLTMSKSDDQTRRVASVGKYSSRGSAESTNAIQRAYNYDISAIDLPDDGEILQYGDYVMMLVEALPNKGVRECKRFAVIVRLLAFGKNINAPAERS